MEHLLEICAHSQEREKLRRFFHRHFIKNNYNVLLYGDQVQHKSVLIIVLNSE